jgi:hypothetical protein
VSGASSGSSGNSGNSGAGGSSASSASSSAGTSSASSGSGASSSSGTGGGGPLTVAGDLLVDVDVYDSTAGTASWTNKGTLGGVFKAQGDPTKGMSGGHDAVVFDGDDGYRGPNSSPTIEGNDDRSIEVWVLNPSIDDEESVVSWSDRKGAVIATMLSFNYGDHPTWGAVTHMHAPDLAWGPSSADVPLKDQWHHLAYTYDGTTVTVFADGEKKTEKKNVTLATKGKFSINLAMEREGTKFLLHGSLSIAVVRIHSEALTAAGVKANYDLEKMRFQ